MRSGCTMISKKRYGSFLLLTLGWWGRVIIHLIIKLIKNATVKVNNDLNANPTKPCLMFISSVPEMILKVVCLPGACLFANLGVSQMKSKTGPCIQRARRDRRKRLLQMGRRQF